MADGRHFKKRYMRYLCSRSTDFDEIWCRDATQLSQRDRKPKISNFKIQDGGWWPPLKSKDRDMSETQKILHNGTY